MAKYEEDKDREFVVELETFAAVVGGSGAPLPDGTDAAAWCEAAIEKFKVVGSDKLSINMLDFIISSPFFVSADWKEKVQLAFEGYDFNNDKPSPTADDKGGYESKVSRRLCGVLRSGIHARCIVRDQNQFLFPSQPCSQRYFRSLAQKSPSLSSRVCVGSSSWARITLSTTRRPCLQRKELLRSSPPRQCA